MCHFHPRKMKQVCDPMLGNNWVDVRCYERTWRLVCLENLAKRRTSRAILSKQTTRPFQWRQCELLSKRWCHVKCFSTQIDFLFSGKRVVRQWEIGSGTYHRRFEQQAERKREEADHLDWQTEREPGAARRPRVPASRAARGPQQGELWIEGTWIRNRKQRLKELHVSFWWTPSLFLCGRVLAGFGSRAHEQSKCRFRNKNAHQTEAKVPNQS